MCICFAKWPTTLHEHAARFRSPTFPVATYSPRFSTLTLIFALVHSALCLHSVCMLVIHCVFVCVCCFLTLFCITMPGTVLLFCLSKAFCATWWKNGTKVLKVFETNFLVGRRCPRGLLILWSRRFS